MGDAAVTLSVWATIFEVTWGYWFVISRIISISGITAITYTAIVTGLPCVVTSVDDISTFPITNKCNGLG